MTVRAGLQYISGEADTGALVGQLLSLEPGRITIEHLCSHCGSPEHGAPILLIDDEYVPQRISISHTPHWLAVAITDGEHPEQRVGIDIETLKRVARHDVADIAYTASEAEAVAGLPETQQAAAATLVWSTKEAVTKSLGIGLRADLTDFECSVVGTVLDQCRVTYPEGESVVHFHSPSPGVMAAVATSSDEQVVWLSWRRHEHP
jgi:phosphopantetheinyl transferase